MLDILEETQGVWENIPSEDKHIFPHLSTPLERAWKKNKDVLSLNFPVSKVTVAILIQVTFYKMVFDHLWVHKGTVHCR